MEKTNTTAAPFYKTTLLCHDLIRRELLNVGKRLSKERDEMSRELGKLQESVMELHDKLIMEIQVRQMALVNLKFRLSSHTDCKLLVIHYNSRVINYDCKAFIDVLQI